MTPPEPMTEEKIRQRYAKIKENILKSNEQDRKEAEKYARDFAKYQKYQAEQLRKIMAQAEQQRSNMLTKIAQQEQRALERFRQQHVPIYTSIIILSSLIPTHPAIKMVNDTFNSIAMLVPLLKYVF